MQSSNQTRRTLLKAMGSGLASLALPLPALAAGKQIVVADPGGPYTKAYRKAESDALDHAFYWLEVVDLVDCANRLAGELSYGQQRRLEIARSIRCQSLVTGHGSKRDLAAIDLLKVGLDLNGDRLVACAARSHGIRVV